MDSSGFAILSTWAVTRKSKNVYSCCRSGALQGTCNEVLCPAYKEDAGLMGERGANFWFAERTRLLHEEAAAMTVNSGCEQNTAS